MESARHPLVRKSRRDSEMAEGPGGATHPAESAVSALINFEWRVIPRLAERAEGPRKRWTACATLCASTSHRSLILACRSTLQLRGPSPSARLGMTPYFRVNDSNASEDHA